MYMYVMFMWQKSGRIRGSDVQRATSWSDRRTNELENVRNVHRFELRVCDAYQILTMTLSTLCTPFFRPIYRNRICYASSTLLVAANVV